MSEVSAKSGAEGRQIARRIVVRGRVQGVWYRASCREQAVLLGIRGSVGNRPDGAVEVRAEGEPEAIDQLVAWCRQGPPHAQVAAVEVEDAELTSADDFRIARS